MVKQKGQVNLYLSMPNPIKIYQYDLDGNFIQKWDNTKVAAKHLNINTASISNCLLGKYKTAGGFIWKKVLDKKGGYFA